MRAPKCLATEVIPAYILTDQSQNGEGSQSEAISHIPLTDLIPLSSDCVAVYWGISVMVCIMSGNQGFADGLAPNPLVI